jgi:DNA modification methylase
MSASDDEALPGAVRTVDLGRALLIQGDCRQILPALRGRFHAIVSDPPYGIGYNPSTASNTFFGDVTGIAGDDRPFDPRHLLDYVKPVLLFGANNFASRLPDSRHWLAWDKRPGMRSMEFSDCELAWCSIDGVARMIRYTWNGADRGPERGEHWHPTQKPLEVMRIAIESVSVPGHVVCDPYMGSGTTGVAALSRDRKFIGIELEERWFKAAEIRIRRELDQGRLL